MNGELASFGLEISQLELHTEGKQRVMVGFASAHNFPIPEDHGGTTFFEPGAWKRTLKAQTPQVLFHHGMDPEIGEKPLGVPRVAEDTDKGLWTETPLANTRYNSETIIPLLESGALSSMSVAFQAIQVRQADDGRHITEARLREFGPTPFPRNLGASAALHSASLAEFLATGGESPTMEGNGTSPTPPADAARLTWSIDAMRSLEAWERDHAEMERRIARLGGRHGDHPGAHQGASRSA